MNETRYSNDGTPVEKLAEHEGKFWLKVGLNDPRTYGVGFWSLLSVEPPIAEPPPGSIVRDKFQSIAWVRAWGYTEDGVANWVRTGTEGAVHWHEIANRVVVILDTAGADGYPDE